MLRTTTAAAFCSLGKEGTASLSSPGLLAALTIEPALSWLMVRSNSSRPGQRRTTRSDASTQKPQEPKTRTLLGLGSISIVTSAVDVIFILARKPSAVINAGELGMVVATAD